MAVIEEHSDGEGSEDECRGGESIEDSIGEGIHSLEIVSSVADDNEGDNDDDDDEDEEDAVWGGGGVRGFVEKPENPWKILRQYFPSKVGGCPAWLDPLNLPKGERMLCGICDKPVQFVLQVYAEEEDDAFHRTLFVFICTSLACLQQDQLQQCKQGKRLRSVKVFRSQLPRDNPFYSSSPPNPDGTEPPLTEGVPLCSWCGTWKGDKICGGCKQTRYCSQVHQLDHWKGDHAPYCRRVQERLKSVSVDAVEGSTATIPSSDAEAPSVAFPSNLWPEYELIVDGDEEDDDVGYNRNSGTGTGRLLADYENRRRQGGDLSAKDVQGVEESSAEEQQWALFQTKTSRSPEQVLWYLRSADARPLWPKLAGQPKRSDIPVCSLCGSERTFEFQILPQLLYFFGVQDNPDSLDWGTIAVYTCRQSCKIQGYCEEFPWVQPGFS